MIKRKKVKTPEIVLSVLLILAGISMLFYLEFSLDINEMIEVEGIEDTMICVLLGYLYSGVVIWFGAFIFLEGINRSEHPENYNYCKRCKHIIHKEKGIFCNSCTYSIENSLERNNEKYFTTYKKNYKERYLKLKARMKKK